MVTMENAEEVMQILDRFTRLKQKEIPKELDEYLGYVAKTGDTVFKWSSLKYLFREKLLNVIKNFHDSTPRIDEIPQYPNVDPFNYESMKSSLLERLELFNAAPFTIQRLCELLIDPRKQYSRIDKFMRALEKNILVSTVEPGRKRTESENGDSLDSVVNGDLSLDVNVDIEMESDGMFNNSESTNGNGTATKAEVEAAKEDPKAEDVEKCVTKNTHASDDDNLPNPKKAKLDLPEDSKGDMEESTKTAVESVDKESTEVKQMQCDEKPSEPNTVKDEEPTKNEKSQNDSTKTQSEKTEEKTEDVKVSEEAEATKNDTTKDESDTKQSNDNKTEEATSKSEEDVKTNEDKVGNIDDEITESKEKLHSNEEGKKTQSEVSADIINKEVADEESDKTNPPSAETETVKHEESKENEMQREEICTVVEKQETEIGEKNQAKQTDKRTEKIEETAIEIEKNQEVEKKIETEQTAEKEGVATEAAVEAEEKVATTKTEKVPEKGLDSETKPEPSDKQEDDSNQLKAEKVTTAISDKITEKQDIESDATTASAVVNTEVEVEKKEESTAEKSNTASETTTEVVPQAEVKPQADVKETKEEHVTTPTLALNDQPMEDAAIDEETPSVDEVVMEEAPTTDMATEDLPSTAPSSKPEEESSGMEVDDTSQEAMDQ
ncbi:protein phosphatase 4 regulatory subunit 2-related protein isoform X2 [Musca autumnalis]|uniref:protein phosphatase 4 regulatory subunit 2-related protein isoform X2 n=1 Tax=Musca autumnalis TaxID=221902 RepID=UPI003CF8FC31